MRQIQIELHILTSSKSPYIIDFYCAFFRESKVYFCIELMDASIDSLISSGISEAVLKLIILSVLRGLNYLKDTLEIIHGDIKPSNILLSKAGIVKLCKL